MTDNYIVYDGDCPFCANFVKFTKFKEAAGPIRLVDARQNGPEAQNARAKGYDLDEGMLVRYAGRDYHGSDALHFMATLSTDTDWFNRLNAALYGSKRVARIAYPFLRTGRNATLRLLGKTKIG